MEGNGSNVLKFRGHSETDPKVQGANVKLILKKILKFHCGMDFIILILILPFSNGIGFSTHLLASCLMTEN